MENKWIILLIIIVLAVIGLVSFYSFSINETEFKVGNSTFILPEGYHLENSSNTSAILSNGTEKIYIEEHNGKNVSKHINNYIDHSSKNNKTVKISNFTVGKTPVFKSNINGSNAVHFWFVKNKKTYTIYSWNENTQIDSITTKLIETIK